MMTVHEVSRLAGVSIRTLQYYDKIGLLRPDSYSDSGYRLYDNSALERLQQILLFRELEFSLTEINDIINDPGFDKEKALDRQIELLTLKKQRLESIIELARSIKDKGAFQMNFEPFDKKKIDEYSRRAKEQWGGTREYAEYEEKSRARSKNDEYSSASELMSVFGEFGKLRANSPDSNEVKAQVKKLQDCITNNYYTCTNEILASLGQMYTENDEFKQNIDSAGGEGTAEFVSEAIKGYTKE